MINYLIVLFGDSILCSFLSFFWNSLLEKESNIKKDIKKIIIITLTTNTISYIIEQPARLLITYLILIIINYYLYSKKIKKSILSVAISEATIWISEFSFVLFMNAIFGKNIDNMMENNYIFIILNLYVLIISLFFLKAKVPQKIFKIFNSPRYISNKMEPIIYSMMIIIVVITSTVQSHMDFPLVSILTTNTIMAIIFILIIIKFANVKSNYNKINDKYQTSITSLKEYETMIDKFRVNTHENKNELLTIRNMIKNNDKKSIEYIDKLVDNKIKDNEKIMYQTSKIPEGGLRATIYSKLCVMEKYKIKYKLDISKNVRTVDLINLDEEVILNICKILGVFMDNSIEAVKNLKKKEINIELYVIDEELYIDITNNFKGNIDISKIGHERHTTKGENHGYGLLLVNKIINENKKYLENENSINGEYFTQTLKIKIK
ncbi:MAG: GHKL domain-containing protein [Bacilli bacterium]|nr:GHKL domain-containing protein [Bacilli bacterium]